MTAHVVFHCFGPGSVTIKAIPLQGPSGGVIEPVVVAVLAEGQTFQHPVVTNVMALYIDEPPNVKGLN